MPVRRPIAALPLVLLTLAGCAPSLSPDGPDTSDAARLAASSAAIAARDMGYAGAVAARSLAASLKTSAQDLSDGLVVRQMPLVQRGTVHPSGETLDALDGRWDETRVLQWYVSLPQGIFSVRQAGPKLSPGQEVMVVRQNLHLVLVPLAPE